MNTVSVRTSAEGWPVPYLIDGNWARASAESMRVLKQNIANQAPALSYAVNQVVEFRCRQLSFYPGGQLCEGLLQDASGVVDLVNLRNGDTIVLNGTADPIHKMNASQGISLDSSDQATEYLQFFDAGVYAEDGDFRLLQDARDLRWKDQPPSSEIEKAQSIIRATLMKKNDAGKWYTNATVQYGQSIYNCQFIISPENGTVEMNDDSAVFQSAHLARDKFNGPIRSTY